MGACGDNSCMFGAPGGMGTNGGCRCLEDVPRERRMAVRKAVHTLRTDLARVTDERDRLRAHLEVAIDLAEEGWGYASEYFCQKWRFDERVLALRTVAGVGADEPLPTDEAKRILRRETHADVERG
jgi:hypothetical protein